MAEASCAFWWASMSGYDHDGCIMGMEPAFPAILPTRLTTAGAVGDPRPFSQKAGPVDDHATALTGQNRMLGELL
jgi:hypothetical protein